MSRTTGNDSNENKKKRKSLEGIRVSEMVSEGASDEAGQADEPHADGTKDRGLQTAAACSLDEG
ncbi:hypothetical protein E4U42_001599 [Claviceps africana]|uniref:Uncharacterized protein n=1 Tax=Claviceps africana TaxID=83212 RepID=A0A8K0NJ48_9HYPO|nr:hypothetical protein E4U42_001599 [Claviceps africana]